MKIPFENELKMGGAICLSVMAGFCGGIVYSPHVRYHQEAVQDVAASAELVEDCAFDLRLCRSEMESYREGEEMYSGLFDECSRQRDMLYAQEDGAEIDAGSYEDIGGLVGQEGAIRDDYRIGFGQEPYEIDGDAVLDEMEIIGEQMDEMIEMMEGREDN